MECKLCLQNFVLSALGASARAWIVPTFSCPCIGLDIPLLGKFDRELAFLAFCGKIARRRSAQV